MTLETALALLSLPREVARHPTSGEPILAGIGRYGAYVQHGKTYANLGRDDDVLNIGGNRAIDLIVAKESGAGGSRFGGGTSRVLGEHPQGGPVSVKQGRFGSYVNHGKVNATIPKGRRSGRSLARQRDRALERQGCWRGRRGGCSANIRAAEPVTVREGRFGPYVNWGKVNANIPKSMRPDSISLGEALELIAEREGKPAPRKAPAKAAPVKAAPAKTAAAKKAPKPAPVKKPAAKAAAKSQ